MSSTAVSPNPPAESQPHQAPAHSVMGGKSDNQTPLEDVGTSKSDRKLLKVPSRSSSQQRNHSSAASTGLSGATVTDHRNSIGGRSKESRGSFSGRQRNGSASSRRSGRDSEQGNTCRNLQPSSPSASEQKKRKKRGGSLLMLLGCCVVPAAAKAVDDGEPENVQKVKKLPARPATAKSRPQAPVKALDEKEPHKNVTLLASDDDNEASGSGDNQVPGSETHDGEPKQPTPPAVTVDPPKSESQESSNERRGNDKSDSGDEDVSMPDALPEEPQVVPLAAQTDEPQQRTVPPPPPPPGPGSSAIDPLALSETDPAAHEPQKWLLPPMAVKHKGRKCLVLDLDETLVHSSFKVRHQIPKLSAPSLQPLRSCTRRTSQYRSR